MIAIETFLAVQFLDKIDYEKALQLQRCLVNARKQNKVKDVLLLLEHPPVITLGRNGDTSHILYSKEVLEQHGIRVYQTDRGGNVTYHGPGQIVGYPILDLRQSSLDVKKYVWMLEEVFIDLLKTEYGIEAGRDPENRGVWVGENKITAIGCAFKSGVTMHGFAFNVNTNLEHFRLIEPCGIVGKGVTSLEFLLKNQLDLEHLKKIVLHYFCKVFKMQPNIITSEELQLMLKENFTV